MNFKDDVFCSKQYKISNQIFKRKKNNIYQTTLEKIMLYCIFYTHDYLDKEANIVIRYRDLKALLEKVIKDYYSEEYNNCLMESIDYDNECQTTTKFNVEKFFLITDFDRKVNIRIIGKDKIEAIFP